MVAITLIAGAAVFGYVNGLSGSSSNAVGNSAANNINFLNERLSIVTEQFIPSPCSITCAGVNIWGFNNGKVSYTLFSIQIQSASGSTNYLDLVMYQTLSSCPTGKICGPVGSGSNWVPSGYVEYDSAGNQVCTSGSLDSGFAGQGTTPVTTLTIDSFPYQVTVPTLSGCGSIYLGQSYTILLTGIYGSTVQTNVEATG